MNERDSIRFPGQYFDEETGLHYNRFRYYDPSIGRYISADPIGQLGGVNLYSYAGNNPVNWFDFLGLYTEVIFWSGHGVDLSTSFGHVTVDINGATYSFGPGGNFPESTADYLRRNSFRNATGIELDLTPEEEMTLETILGAEQGEYDFITNNCGDPVETGLESLGVDLGINVTPTSLFDSINASDRGISTQSHPASGPNRREPFWRWSPSF